MWCLFRGRADQIIFSALAAAVIVGQLFLGFEIITVRLHFVVVSVLQAFLATLSFTGFISLSGLFFLGQLVDRPRVPRVEASEAVTAIVPVYRDANVLSTSVTSLVASSHPVDVTVVCEPGDRPSIDEAERLAASFDAVSVLENTRYPGSKAGAINYAVEQTDAAYIGVFDADERVHPAFVEHAAARLEDVEIVQGRTVPRPDGLLESLAYYESVLLSYVGRRLLYAVTGFRMAASRAVLFRRDAFDAVGGYDPAMLTEDYYFGYQCYTAGLSVREQLHFPSTIESAHTVTDWWGQRKRWMRGYMQVLHRLAVDATTPRSYRSLLAVAICGSSVIGGVMLLSLPAKFLVLLGIGAGRLLAVPLGAVIAVAAAVRYLDYRRGTLDGMGLSWLLSPLLFPLYGFAAIKAVVEYTVEGAGEWYQVQKGS